MKKGVKSKKTKAVKKTTAKISKKTVPKKTAAKKVVKKTVAKKAVKKSVPKKTTKKVVKKVVKKSAPKKAVKKVAPKKTVKKAVPKKVTKKVVKKVVKKSAPKKAVKKVAKKTAVKKSPKKVAKKAVVKKQAAAPETKLLGDLGDLPPPPTFEDFTDDDYANTFSDVSHDESVSKIGYKPITDVSLNHDEQSMQQSDDSFTPADSDELSLDIDSDVPSMQEIQEVLGKPEKKKGFFSKLFGKKEEPVVEATPETNDKNIDFSLEKIADQTQNDLDALSVDNEQKAVSELDEAHARQEDYVTNLRRRLDMEMQERQQHVQEAHEELNAREVELEQRHQQILAKEKELAQHAQKYDELSELQSQIEDKHITLEKRHQEIDMLREELAAKEQDLADKEDELTQKEQELNDRELTIQQATPDPMVQSEDSVEDDDEDFMYRKKQISPVVSQPVVEDDAEDEPVVDVLTQKSRDIHTKLQNAYTALHNSDISEAKSIYVAVTQLYKELTQEQGQDAQLYQDILDLYKDIKLAMVQSI